MPTMPETPRRGGVTGAPSATTGVGAGVSGARRIELSVSGLTCQKCVQAVERALQAVPGVGRATVNLAQGRAFVEYDPGQTTVSALHNAGSLLGPSPAGQVASQRVGPREFFLTIVLARPRLRADWGISSPGEAGRHHFG